MEKAFLIMVALGALIGLSLPAHRAAPAVAALSTPAAAPAPTHHSAEAEPQYMGETRLEIMPDRHFYTSAMVNGQPVRFVVDTGASTVALSEADAQRIGIPFSTAEFQVIGSGASGPVRGKMLDFDSVSVDGKDIRGVRGAVIEGLDVSLLGQTYLSRIGSVQMSGDTMTLR
jgi:aspartyl protease family protein